MPRQREAPAVKTDHIMIASTTVNNSVPQFKYHVINSQGEHTESNLPDEHTAQAVIDHLKLTDPLNVYTVEQEQIITKESLRLGRDPDLH